MSSLVTVITIGRRRVDTLERCVQSVASQSYRPIEHILLSDDCPVFSSASRSLAARYPYLRIIMLEPSPERYLPARAARARNYGVSVACGDYVAFLDDDNTWESNHIGSLVGVIATPSATGAAHSYRRIWNIDGTPYLLPLHPWTDSLDPHEKYREFADLGIYSPGTNFVRDCVTARRDGRDEGIFTVDMSAWLLRIDVARRFPLKTEYSEREVKAKMSEDACLCEAMYQAGVSIGTSGLFTLNYFLGGFSTSIAGDWLGGIVHSEATNACDSESA